MSEPMVRRDSPVPLYYQVYQILLEDLRSGRYRPGDQIPPEPVLTQRFGVSRITVNQALQRLVNEGFVYRVQGKGTFVSNPPIGRRLKVVESLTEEMAKKGIDLVTRSIEIGQEPAGDHVGAELEIAPESEVYVIRRLRGSADEMLALQTTHIPVALCPGLIEIPELRTGSLYEVLNRHFGFRPVWARETYRVVVEPTVAAQLKIGAKSPLFAVTRRALLATGVPIEWTSSYMRTDRFQLEVELGTSPEPGPPRA